MAVLEVNNLSIALPRAGQWQRVVNQVHFSLSAGTITGLVGESGSGKSLTARALLGLVPGAARCYGELLLRGAPMQDWHETEWRRHRGRELAMIFQDPLLALNPLRRIGSQMGEVLARHHPLPRAQRHDYLLRALQRVRLPRADWVLRAYPHELSGGMRQRVMIAMALLGQPRVLLADEPTAALDTTTRSRVLSELLRARDDTGCAILLISHDLALVEQVCDEILIMYAGRIMERGRGRQVMQQPRHPYSAALIASRPRLQAGEAGRLTVIAGQFSAADRDLPGCVFAPRCPRATAVCRSRQPPWTETAQHMMASASVPGTHECGSGPATLSAAAGGEENHAHGATPGFACYHPLPELP